jgi:hypothetical protein
MAGKGSGNGERGTKQVGARDVQTVNLLKEEVIGNTGYMKSGRDHQVACDASMQVAM